MVESIEDLVFWLLVMVMMIRLCCRFGLVLVLVLVVGVVDVDVGDVGVADDVVADSIRLVFWIELDSGLFDLDWAVGVDVGVGGVVGGVMCRMWEGYLSLRIDLSIRLVF